MGFSSLSMLQLQDLPQMAGAQIAAPQFAAPQMAAPQQQQQILPQMAPPQQAAPQPNPRSIFDLLIRPQPAQFNVRQATGTKPKNYTPASVTMSGLPAASVFAFNPGALPQQAFTVIPASGTKPKNYRPAQVLMNAPSLAGPGAMQQMLAMMRGVATPFAPFGQRQG